jgi:phage-related tail protein
MADAGLRLTVDGEREFKKAISEINDLLKVNSSELRLLSEQYKSSDKSLETMTGKQKTLSEAMDLQSQKIEEIGKQLSDAEKIYGKTGARTLELTVQYNNARTALTKLTTEYNAVTDEIKRTEDAEADFNKRLAENSDKIDKIKNPTKRAKAETKELRDAVRELTEKYGANNTAVRKHTEELKNAEKQLNKTEDATEDLSEANDGGKLSLDGLFKSGSDTNKLFDEMNSLLGEKLSGTVSNLSGTLSSFAGTFAAVGTGVAAAKGIISTVVSAGDSFREMKEQAEMLGMDLTSYQELEYALNMVGISSSNFTEIMNPLYSKISETYKVVGKYAGHMEDLQYATDEEREAVTNAMNEWDKYGVALLDQSGNLRDIEDIFYDIIDVAGTYTNETERMVYLQRIWGESASKVNRIVRAGGDAIRDYADAAKDAGAVTEAYLVEALYNVSIAMDNSKRAWDRTKEAIGAAVYSTLTFDFSSAWDMVKLAGQNFASIFRGGKPKGYASGTDFYPGGLSLVGEYGPEIVQLPRGTRIYPNGTAPNLGTAENNTYNISINARNVREFNDIVKMAQSARVRARMR